VALGGVQVAEAFISGNIDLFRLERLFGLEIEDATSSHLGLAGGLLRVDIGGVNLTYDADAQLSGGAITAITFVEYRPGPDHLMDTSLTLNGISITAALANQYLYAADTPGALTLVLSGSDTVHGGPTSDLLRGYDGNDFISAGGGSDTIYGGAGADYINAGDVTAEPGQASYLRGDEGDDQIFGSGGFDDINGNMGNDTCVSGGGDDWVVGGKDNDSLTGSDGSNLVYGNLGNDTCDGGGGNDIVRGGQDDDLVSGGAGDDFVSGDRGGDRMTGGAGADIFHTFGAADLDVVTDFNRAQGDRVQLDPGTQYTASQQGGDVHIDMVGGGKMVLLNVQLSSLSGDWIFGA
jgi:Ca2+-binding RTX toxin-like protein